MPVSGITDNALLHIPLRLRNQTDLNTADGLDQTVRLMPNCHRYTFVIDAI